MAFEKLLGVEVPRRARWMRTIFAELQRIASHLLWLGTFTLDLGGALGGGTTLFMHAFRERESILDLFEDVSGARFHYNTHTIGGNRHDIPAGWDAKVRAALDIIEARLPEYESMSVGNSIFIARTKGIGVLDGALALELGITGPNLRASGVDHDLRRDAPYGAYDELKVRPCVATEWRLPRAEHECAWTRCATASAWCARGSRACPRAPSAATSRSASRPR